MFSDILVLAGHSDIACTCMVLAAWYLKLLVHCFLEPLM